MPNSILNSFLISNAQLDICVYVIKPKMLSVTLVELWQKNGLFFIELPFFTSFSTNLLHIIWAYNVTTSCEFHLKCNKITTTQQNDSFNRRMVFFKLCKKTSFQFDFNSLLSIYYLIVDIWTINCSNNNELIDRFSKEKNRFERATFRGEFIGRI